MQLIFHFLNGPTFNHCTNDQLMIMLKMSKLVTTPKRKQICSMEVLLSNCVIYNHLRFEDLKPLTTLLYES